MNPYEIKFWMDRLIEDELEADKKFRESKKHNSDGGGVATGE